MTIPEIEGLAKQHGLTLRHNKDGGQLLMGSVVLGMSQGRGWESCLYAWLLGYICGRGLDRIMGAHKQ